MGEIHVRAGAAGAGGTLPTLRAAAQVARAGDVVVVHAGVYRERLEPPARTTWRAAEGEGPPVIDLGWDNKPADSLGQEGVLINAPGVIVRGFEIRNVSGNGIGIAAGGDGCLIEGCEIHHTMDGGLSANGTGTPIRSITIRGCHVHDISLSGRWRETPVNGCFLFKGCEYVVVEDVLIERGHGEGIAAGTRSKGLIFRRVTVRRMKHVLAYLSNRAQDVVWEDCVFYQVADEQEFRQGDGDVGQIAIGDELSERSARWQHAENVTMRRCLVVNAGSGWSLRNQIKTINGKPDGYETTIQNFVVENCTFVTGNNSKAGIGIQENERPGGLKVKGIFRNNIFIFDRLAQGGAVLRNEAGGVRFEMNAWSVLPDGLGPSNAEIAATALVNPFAEEFDLDNYRPRAGGPLATAGLGALGPEGPEPPVEPPPADEVDWDELLALTAEATAEAVSANMAADRASRLMQRVTNQIEEYRAAALGGEE